MNFCINRIEKNMTLLEINTAIDKLLKYAFMNEIDKEECFYSIDCKSYSLDELYEMREALN